MAITPLNPLVRTMLTSLHGAMSKGMPLDQAMTYVKSMAQQGIAPLVDLSAMLRQFDQLKQPESRPMQTGTVRDQINMAAQARAGGLGGFQMQPMQAAPPMVTQAVPQMSPQMVPQASGLASLDAGRMENPQGFNQGGIVAFDEGGRAASTSPVTAANVAKPRSLEEIYSDLAALQAKGYVPQFKDAAEEQRQIEQEMGIGEYAKSLEEEKALLGKQEKRSLEELEADRANLRRQEAADIARESTRSRSALEAMAKARSGAVTRERELEKEIRAARNEREKAAIGLTKAVETAKEKRSAAAAANVEKKRNRLETVENQIAQNQAELKKIEREGEIRRDITRIELSGRENIARLEANLKMGLTERAGQIERDIKMGTASTEDQLGWDYITTLRAKGEDHPDTKAALERYKEAMGFRYTRSSGGTPIDMSQARPAAGGSPATPVPNGNVDGWGGRQVG